MSFTIQNIRVGGGEPFFILGPCALESEAFAWEMARALKEITTRTGSPFVFKASFDKANRTSVSSFRGPGPQEGCRILGEIGKELQVPVTTDIHTAEQADIAAQHVDILQIPAFLCRQTDLLEAAAKTGRVVNVKKGQFLAPWDTINIADKLRSFGCEKFFITERGTTFGYNNLVADMRSLPILAGFGYPTVFDVTHSVQLPGGQGDSSGGQREFGPVLARCAVAAGVHGLFIETHPEPDRALSDGPNMIPLNQMPALLRQLQRIQRAL
jgi:2-dehydro-3-deoxyphosphooctonate aldolase (KDO 8-P synthase)